MKTLLIYFACEKLNNNLLPIRVFRLTFFDKTNNTKKMYNRFIINGFEKLTKNCFSLSSFVSSVTKNFETIYEVTFFLVTTITVFVPFDKHFLAISKLVFIIRVFF